MGWLIVGILVGANVRFVRTSAEWVLAILVLPLYGFHQMYTKGINEMFREAFAEELDDNAREEA